MKVFIVEDEKNLQFLYEQILTLKGLEILDFANDGEEAISKFSNFPEKPDIILMDNRMPRKDGIEASKEILSQDNRAKIIFLSADASVKKEALSIGAIAFLNKPIDMFKLIKHIFKHVNNNDISV